MTGRFALVVAAAALAAGCSGSDGDGGEGDERVIRGWSSAVNAGDLERAAGYFAEGAIVEQLEEFRLDGRADALAFNRSLPCRADVTDVEREEGSTLAAFKLRPGRDGRCPEGGSARVRFVIRDGRIREWRQLPEPDEPDGPVAGPSPSRSRSRTI